MIVLSIFGGSVGIGASAFYSSGFGRDLAESARIGLNDLRFNNVAPVASMTPEEVKLMDDLAECIFTVWDMAHDDPSLWDNYLVKFEKFFESAKLLKSMKRSLVDFWDEHYYLKKESWKYADSIFQRMFTGTFARLNFKLMCNLARWLSDHGIEIS